MGGEDVELVADGRRVLVREGTAVGWLRVRNGAGWVCCGLCLVSGCVRPGWGLGAGVGGVGWVAAGVRVADPADLVFRFVRPPHAASQASQDDFAASDII